MGLSSGLTEITTEQLLRIILEYPSDTLAIKAYADLLEEFGKEFHQKQAKFIHASVDLGLIVIHPPKCLTPWQCGHTPEDLELGETNWVWKNGFLYGIELTEEEFENKSKVLFSRNPIEWVILSDTQPFNFSSEEVFDNQITYAWDHPRSYLNDNKRLKESLFDMLQNYLQIGTSKCYRTKHLALKALSDILVDIGRECVGLPKLKRSRDSE